MTWQPIETAPKDGTDVALAGTSEKFGAWEVRETWWMNDGWYGIGPDHTPTHWKAPDA
jgi:hypothetical protein